jgi:hypothetical protein
MRFLDEDGGITMAALRYIYAETQHEKVLGQFEKASWLRKQLLSRQARYFLRQTSRFRRMCCAHALQQLANTALNRRKIATENPDRSFAMAEADELHELLEATLQGKEYWIFVFEPMSSLCADQLTPIAQIM